jgi:hypothetical protein
MEDWEYVSHRSRKRLQKHSGVLNALHEPRWSKRCVVYASVPVRDSLTQQTLRSEFRGKLT